MARPRQFDEEQTLEQALQVFWRQGYEGTSIHDLEQATGLGRASLYGAFGDKPALFERVLDRFQARNAELQPVLDDAPTVRQGLDRLFERWLELHEQRGCLVLSVASESGCQPALRPRLLEAVRATEALFSQALRRAEQNGELPAGASPTLRSRLLLVGLQGLSSATRQGHPRRELTAIARLLVASAFGPFQEAERPAPAARSPCHS